MPNTKAGKKLLRKWSELFPNGRFIFYEGDDPQGFVEEIKTKFGFDPSKDNPYWGEEGSEDDEQWKSYGFYCPVEHLDEIYAGAYPMGS